MLSLVFADKYGWWLTFDPKAMLFIKNVCGSLVTLRIAWFCLGWCQRRPEHWVGTQLNIGSVSLSNTKRLLSDCLHSFMRRVGFTNVCIFMCSFACLGFGVSYPPILVGYDSWFGCNLNSIAALFPSTTNQFTFVGERASDRFYWSSPFTAKQSPKSSRVCKFQEVQMLRNLKANAGNLIII